MPGTRSPYALSKVPLPADCRRPTWCLGSPGDAHAERGGGGAPGSHPQIHVCPPYRCLGHRATLRRALVGAVLLESGKGIQCLSLMEHGGLCLPGLHHLPVSVRHGVVRRALWPPGEDVLRMRRWHLRSGNLVSCERFKRF